MDMSQSQTTSIFAEFQQIFNNDHALREEIRTVVREIEQTCREIAMVLLAVHQPTSINKVSELCSSTEDMFKKVQTQFASLASKLDNDYYYRFHDMWRFGIQKAAFLSAFVVYLQTGALATREEVAAMLGVKVKREEGFHIDLDDYLMALLQMVNELSRLAVNAVTAGDYTQPFRIASFVAELDAGFRLLNLKNDQLRKRFDSLKYNLKKIEEVVYDVTIRQLKPKDTKDVAIVDIKDLNSKDVDSKDDSSTT